MDCSVALQILALDAQTNSEVCRVVDSVIDYISTCDVRYFVGPFETTIEGDFDVCMDVLKQAQLIAKQAGAKHVMCYAKINWNLQEPLLTTEQKVGKYLMTNTLDIDE